ncbi:hypothetical protein [Tenacibaculum bernardetii]|uniref:hypothetical protein n=1 Tax=Tenacibaculum bernardetii TaxID=3021375 RepID=UPI0023B18A53|nr:hypothetical protein [Tenacibaculum bernardetii]
MKNIKKVIDNKLKTKSMKKEIKKLRKELKLVIGKHDNIIDVMKYGNEKQVQIKFDSISEMEARYDSWKTLVHSTNFVGNPYENNSYMKIEEEEYLVVIYPPKYINGDSNWTKYRVDELDFLHTVATISFFFTKE